MLGGGRRARKSRPAATVDIAGSMHCVAGRPLSGGLPHEVNHLIQHDNAAPGSYPEGTPPAHDGRFRALGLQLPLQRSGRSFDCLTHHRQNSRQLLPRKNKSAPTGSVGSRRAAPASMYASQPEHRGLRHQVNVGDVMKVASRAQLPHRAHDVRQLPVEPAAVDAVDEAGHRRAAWHRARAGASPARSMPWVAAQKPQWLGVHLKSTIKSLIRFSVRIYDLMEPPTT